MNTIVRSKLFWLLFTGFIVTISYSFIYRIHPVVDARSYDTIAINILQGDGFREQPGLPIEFDTSILRAGPGYEYFLAFVYLLFGHHLEIVWVIQAILHVLTAYFIYLTCKRLFSEGSEIIGLISAALFVFHPDLIEISAMLMTETLYLFLTVLLIYLFQLSFENDKSISLATLSGIILALAILNRPTVVLYGIVFIALYFIRKSYRSALIFCVLATLFMLPWIIRNYKIYDQLIPTTLIGEYNIWIGNRVGSDGGQISGGYNPATTFGEKFGYLNFKNEAVKQTKTFILSNPGEFIMITASRIKSFFSLIRPMGFWFYQNGLKQIIFVCFSFLAISLIFISGIAGYIFSIRARAPANYYWLAFAILTPLPLIFSVVESRYRFQIYPLLVIFSGYFIWNFYKKRSESMKPLVYALSTLGVVTLIDVLTSVSEILSHLQNLL